MTAGEARKLEDQLQFLVFGRVVESVSKTHYLVHAVEASFAEYPIAGYDVYITLNPLHGIVENMNPEKTKEVALSKFEAEYKLEPDTRF